MKLQFAIALLSMAVLCVPLVSDSRRVRAAVDIAFGVGTLVLLFVVMSQGSGLHPDSPVMTSGDMRIKLPFYAMFVSQMLMCSGFVALTKSLITTNSK